MASSHFAKNIKEPPVPRSFVYTGPLMPREAIIINPKKGSISAVGLGSSSSILYNSSSIKEYQQCLKEGGNHESCKKYLD